MKKALTLIVLIVTPAMAFAQGTVTLANQTGLVRMWTSPSDPTLINVPKGGGYVELIAAPVGTALVNPLFSATSALNYSSIAGFLAANPGWAAACGPNGATTPNPAPIAAAAGVFNDGVYTIQNIVPGAYAEYFLIGWTGSASTADAAIAGWFAGQNQFCESAIFTTATGNPGATPPGAPVNLKSTFGGMTIGPPCLDGYFWGFTIQPASQTVLQGAAVTFYVGANACPAPYYQWYFNGVSIPGACGSSFQIPNAQLTNAGTYWAVLSNAVWSGPFSRTVYISASATLTVLEPPYVTQPPQVQTAYAGSTVDLRSKVAGSPPLAYQWLFNGSAISGSGSTDLHLTSVSATQAGTYTLVVTSVAGAVTSAPAILSVIQPVGLRMVPALALQGQPGSLLHLDDADALGPSPGWVTFDSVTLTNSSQWYFDVSTPLPSQRFYRAWQTGGPSDIPALDLKMVPAITMTGLVGGSVHVDYINQFGPTDAWVALDTVMLSNTSQHYFDVSAPGQPPRLYRLVQVP
jgi:hypothetical protein